MNSKIKVIGFAGPAGCGKDTCADYIIAQSRGHLVKESFANPLKRMLQVGLGLTDEQLWGDEKDIIDIRYGTTPRDLMQKLGTEWGRNEVGDDVWVDAMASYLDIDNPHLGTVLIPDVRFPNEAEFVRKYGALVHIQGRHKELDKHASTHVSEDGIEIRIGDYLIDNDGTLNSLFKKLDGTFKDIMEKS